MQPIDFIFMKPTPATEEYSGGLIVRLMAAELIEKCPDINSQECADATLAAANFGPALIGLYGHSAISLARQMATQAQAGVA